MDRISCMLSAFCLLFGFTVSQIVTVRDSTARYNNTATLTCTISPRNATVDVVNWSKTGNPDKKVYSSINGSLGDFVGRVNGKFIPPEHFELYLYNPTLQDSGTYACTMVVGGVPSTGSGYLTVSKSPDIKISPPSLETIEEKKNQTFNCSSGPSYPAVSLTWSCIGVVCSVVQGTTENSTEISLAVIAKLQAICPLQNSTNCTCEASSGHSATVAFKKGDTTGTPGSGQDPFPWWSWILIAIACVGLIVGVAFGVVKLRRCLNN